MRLPLSEYLQSLGSKIVVEGASELMVAGVAVDSRQVRPGFIFCAIPGQKDDGAKYVAAAIAAGAIAVVAQAPMAVPAGIPVILVDNANHAAGRLAAAQYGHPARRMRLLGITGTNGKTTTAFLLNHLCEKAGEIAGMVGTVQYSYGKTVIEADRTTPPALAIQALFAEMVGAHVQTCILEMSSHALEQQRLGDARFRGAIFTNLTGDHLDYHGNMENYYVAKKRLFSECLEPNGIAVINAGDPYGARLCQELRTERPDLRLVSFSLEAGADWQIADVTFRLDGGEFTLAGAGKRLQLHSPLIGWHNAENITGMVLLALSLGYPEPLIVDTVRECTGAPGRLQAVVSPKGFAAYVDYAHTDDALKNVLQALRKLNPVRLTTVFGCGGDRDNTKRPRMGKVAIALSDKVIVTSDNPRTEDPEKIIDQIVDGLPPGAAWRRLADRRAAIRLAVREAVPGEIILLAGKGHENYQEIHGQKHHFDDAEEVRAAMAPQS
jgi:UDP-N-acetylmuramoyl-L-alanyl-D-glutamate--2,6-diaminopimelate ligase